MKKVAVFVLALLLVLPVLAGAQTPTGYIKVDNIVGGVAAGTYTGWSEITGLDWAINSSYSGRAGAVDLGLPVFRMSVTMPLDRASGPIAKRQILGPQSDTVKIELVDVNKNTNATYSYQKFTLINVTFVEHLNKWSPASADTQIPSVSVTMLFTKIKVEHFIINKSGARVKTGEWTYNQATGGA